MTGNRTVEPQAESGWAMSGVAFAATMMLLIGAFHAIAGLAAILNDEYFGDRPGLRLRSGHRPPGAGST